MNKRRTILFIAFLAMITLVATCTAALYGNADTVKTVYVDTLHGSDNNSGTTASSAYATLSKAIKSSKGTDKKIVLVSDMTLSEDYLEPEHSEKITITCSDGKTKYTSTLIFSGNERVYRMSGPTTFEQINVKMTAYGIFAAQFNPISFGGGVNIKGGDDYAFVVGGYEKPSSSSLDTSLDAHVEINSGNFYSVCGFSRTKGVATLTFTGTSYVTVNGGSIERLYGSSIYNHYSGSSVIELRGGNVEYVYAAGDVSRRLDGSSDIYLMGSNVGSVEINNVVGDATLYLYGKLPGSVSVSYYNTTIENLAKKAGSKKILKYNAIFANGTFIDSVSALFDEMENVTTVYVSEGGNGDGSGAHSCLSSFADAYETIGRWGGTMYVVGEAVLDRDTLGASVTQSVNIRGYDQQSTLRLSEGACLGLYSDTVIDGLHIDAAQGSKIKSYTANVIFGQGLSTTGNVDLVLVGKENSDIYARIDGGNYGSLEVSPTNESAAVTVEFTSGRIENVNVLTSASRAESVRFEMCAGEIGTLSAVGGVVDTAVVKLAGGSVGALELLGNAERGILSVASASIGGVNCSFGWDTATLVLGRGSVRSVFADVIDAFDEVKTENAVYVADGGNGNGNSALSPMGDLKSAIASLRGEGSVVICGAYTVQSTGGSLSRYSYPVTITSRDLDRDYSENAYIDMRADILLGGETAFEYLRFTCPNTNAFIYAMERPLVIGEGVDTTLTSANKNYISLCGGRNDTSGNGDASIVVNSGNWGAIRAGSTRTATVGKSHSTITVEINGGTFHKYVLCSSRGKVWGDVFLTVNGGKFMQGVYAVYEEDGNTNYSFDYDIVFDIRGGEFYGDIAPARDKDTVLHGSYKLYLRGGDFSGVVDVLGASVFSGDMESELYVDPLLDLSMDYEEKVSFSNPLRANNADPWLFYYNGYYYYTCTGSTSVSLIKVANLSDIKTASSKVIFKPDAVNLWSPEIHYFSEEEVGVGNEGFYLFVGYDDGTTKNQRQYVAKCLDGDDLMGDWGNPVTGEVNVPVKVEFPDSPNTNNDVFCVGMSKLTINGKCYTTYVSEVGRGTADFHQTINIVEVETPWTMRGVPTVICTPEYEWEMGGSGQSSSDPSLYYPKVVEGASAIYSDSGDVYLMYTGSGYWTVYYQLGYLKLTGKDPLKASSWTKNPTPVLSLSDEINGCGHGSYFRDHEGNWWVCYHAYTGKDTSGGRSSFIERIYPTSKGVTIGNGSGHPAPLDTVYTVNANPMPLRDRIAGFDSASIDESAYGDIDRDTTLTSSDIALLVRYLSGWDIAVERVIADVDKNGTINNRDAIELIKKLS